MELSQEEREKVKETTIRRVFQCAKDVLDDLGTGWSEAVYQKAMEIALREENIQYESQRVLPIYFKDKYVVGEGKPDLIIWVDLEDGKRVCVVFELKYETEIKQEHKTQLIKYIRALRKLQQKDVIVFPSGFVINFQKLNNTKLGDETRGFPDDSSYLRYIKVEA